jgi:hypothetical protein
MGLGDICFAPEVFGHHLFEVPGTSGGESLLRQAGFAQHLRKGIAEGSRNNLDS